MTIDWITLKPLQQKFDGCGTNLWSGDTFIPETLKNLNLSWARLWIDAKKGTTEPGADTLPWTGEQMDGLWQDSDQIKNGCTKNVFDLCRDKNIQVIFTIGGPPSSWMDPSRSPNSHKLTCAEAISAFARYWVSAILVHRLQEIAVEWVELCNEPDGDWTVNIPPGHYVELVKEMQAELKRREVENVRIIGPGTSHLLKEGETENAWITVLREQAQSIARWSIHAWEGDARIINDGTLASRTYVEKQFLANAQQMWGITDIPIFVTEYGTKATKFQPDGPDLGDKAPDSIDYALRLADNTCGLLKGGASALLQWQAHDQDWDTEKEKWGFYNSDGSTSRPQYDLFATIFAKIPAPSTVLVEGDLSPGDETLKVAFLKENHLYLVLSRSQYHDAMDGSLNLALSYPAWTQLSNASIESVTAFPQTVNLSRTQVQPQGTQNSTIHLQCTDLPYQAVVLISLRLVFS